ncbi:stress response protein nst1-like [Copidosoma floridanum]|uniref:stress response protein nst1-like n=1 Tax=Copidosoma floridanum TaxID=29053 RepID=UPI0006C94581|nr:stress response protein nst1-like [Copidosoma floridanum]
MRLVQVVHQEAALKSLAKIRDTVGEEEFGKYLTEVDESMKRNFELLCEIYGIERSSSAKRNRIKSKAASGVKSLQRKDSFEDSIKEVVPVDKSWDSEDSDTSGIAEEDEDNVRASSSASVSSSARVVLETEIKFDEETAITMTILEERAKKPDIQEIDFNMGKDIGEGKPTVELETAEEDVSPEERRKTPKRVHFGGEIVKLRTPDSEDAESVMSIEVNRQQVPSPLSHQQLLPVAPSRTRIPLPVSPATRMPSRPRSSSQPNVTPPSRQLQRLRMQKRSASSSPRREPHTHRSDLSPKKSILTQNTEIHRLVGPGKRGFDIPLAIYRPHISRRDSMTSPRIVIEEMNDILPEEPSFRVCEESSVGSSPRLEIDSSSEKRRKLPG